MDFTTDTRTFDIDNAYMFGTSLLVRPVFHPQSEEKNICIYLPEHSGKYWYDFWTGEAFEGGREQMQTNILDILPLYVKAGSILPLAEAQGRRSLRIESQPENNTRCIRRRRVSMQRTIEYGTYRKACHG